jgi:uncharacterized protein YjdB
MRSTKSLFCLTSAAVLAAVSACTTTTDPAPIASIQLQPGQDSIFPGETYNGWIVTLRDGSGNAITGRTLSWTSQNPEVISINPATGEATGVGTGGSLITVSAGGKQAQATLRVIPPVVSIVTVPDSFDLPLTTTRQINVQLVGPNGLGITGRQIAWASLDPNIVAVSTNGLVTPLAVGTATIRITVSQTQTTVRVRVVPEPVASVRISPQGSVQVIRLGQTKQLTAECLNAAQQVLTGRTITWNSTNPLVASVGINTGLVTGVTVGQSQVAATCDNSVSTSVVAQVTLVPVASVSVAPTQLNLLVGQQGQLTPTARDSANNVLALQNRSVQWTSENIPVATVSNQGVVSAQSQGLANVWVKIDGVDSPLIPVAVNNVPVATVTIGPLNPSVTCGQQTQLTFTARDANGNVLNGRPATWQSQNQAVATIGAASGIATGVTVGTATIVATVEGVTGFAVLTVNPQQAPLSACP